AVARLGRLRQQLELVDALRALAVRRAEAVGAGVAAAEDDDVLPGREDLVADLVTRDLLVLLRQEFHREVDAAELAPRNGELAPPGRASREDDRVVPRLQMLDRYVAADVRVNAKDPALVAHLLQSALDDPLLELEVGNAVHQEPADAVGALENLDRVP